VTIAVIAEKPSVARDIARTLGAKERDDGCLRGGGYVVTWAIGHLVGIAEPHQMRPEWRRWSRDTLPMLPRDWPLEVLEQTKPQFEVIRRVLADRDVDRVVCATDAGREGELIFRLIYEAAACRKPVQRLWISSLTDDAIRSGFRKLRDGRDYDALADAAKGRSRADWLVGMNLSRAYGLSLDERLSVGRVQTPTLAMIVDRDLAIRRFVPEDYLEVVARFSSKTSVSYEGAFFRRPEKGSSPLEHPRRLAFDGEEAKAILDRARRGQARIESVEAVTRRMPPPLLYDLTELQRHANRLFGLSAARTLDVAQGLYEKHKLISYPRTSSRHLSADVSKELAGIVDAVQAPYASLLAETTGQKPLGKRFVDDTKVTDHHAIIPTGARVPVGFDGDEKRLFDLICRRFLAAWQDDFVWDITIVVTAIHMPEPVPKTDLYESQGTAVQVVGWKALDVGSAAAKPPAEKSPGVEKDEADDDSQILPPGLVKGQPQAVLDARAMKKKTRPPRRFNDATLLTAMETAGKTLEEKELSEAMKENGLGTPATRAGIIETLLSREYLLRDGKTISATEKGIRLISVVDPAVKSPEMTGRWEARLQQIERGKGDLGSFMSGIEEYVREVIGRVPARQQASLPPTSEPRSVAPTIEYGTHPIGLAPRPPVPADALKLLLSQVFGFTSFRPHQEAVCRAATNGNDLLLVMPTGAGKSLCYQIPGLARGGTTLVVSPLVALMEDQVAKLRALSLRAQRIHSGRDRAESRRVCLEYLAGSLDFLFIAPERLGVAGFPEFLAKRKPSLIAIDEAHCISQWGHDFRPDYRLLGQRLPLLMPAPIIALTATATPEVQRDIVAQLGLRSGRTFIHGFRRDNLGVEVLELSPRDRAAEVRRLLSDASRRPAILYAPTRKVAEATTEALRDRFSVAAYHAGLAPNVRARVQEAFLGGKLDIAVATIAFGMGIDKADVRTVIHLALPASVEGYYQEIGRAGRDGKPSRALLLHSFADRRTHDFFHTRDYPETSVLEKICRALAKGPQPRDTLAAKLRLEQDVLEKALDKLCVHGGVEITPGDEVSLGGPGWQKPYEAQRQRRLDMMAEMVRFAEGRGCRMQRLVRHFGDREDSGAACGRCDFCAPDKCWSVEFRTPDAPEKQTLSGLLAALRTYDGQATGRLSREQIGPQLEDRRRFETLLGGLVKAGLVEVNPDTFEKDGKTITFERAFLTRLGRAVKDASGVTLRKARESTPKDSKKRGKASREKRPGKSPKVSEKRPVVAANPAFKETLKQWRAQEAKRRKIPAFRILSNATLEVIAATRPRDEVALLRINGVGPKIAESYGVILLKLCR